MAYPIDLAATDDHGDVAARMNGHAVDLEAVLIERLIRQGLVDEAGLERARSATLRSAARLHLVLTRLGLVAERDMALLLADLLGLEVAKPADYPAVALLEDTLARRFLKEQMVLPLAASDDGIVLAMADPFESYALDAVRIATGLPVRPRIALPAELEAALNRLYREPGGETDAAGGDEQDDDLDRLRDRASEAPVVRLANQLIDRAVAAGASDIHIEPEAHRISLRFRIDGQLRPIDGPPKAMHQALLSRLKLMARLDIAERRLPQDGQIRVASGGREIDLRVATMPSLHGETMVLRVLNRDKVPLDLEGLGYGETTLGQIQDLLGRPNGIVLVTGPTGSGKSTTLYTALRLLTTSGRKLLSVEDPIEHHLEGVTQVQVKPSIGLSFARVLRGMLRHDPDVVMVGEIRDPDTAEIAVQAALTGHLVLSTLHTNSAVATIHRLLDMGIADYLLAPTVTGVVAQRLVRRLCPACSRPADSAELLAGRMFADRARFPAVDLRQPEGCESCGGSGYRGRLAVAEVLTMTDPLRRLVIGGAPADELERMAVEGGMRRLIDDGLAKVAAGQTALADVLPLGHEA